MVKTYPSKLPAELWSQISIIGVIYRALEVEYTQMYAF